MQDSSGHFKRVNRHGLLVTECDKHDNPAWQRRPTQSYPGQRLLQVPDGSSCCNVLSIVYASMFRKKDLQGPGGPSKMQCALNKHTARRLTNAGKRHVKWSLMAAQKHDYGAGAWKGYMSDGAAN